MSKFFLRDFSFLIIFLLTCFLFLWHLGYGYLTNWDEAWYADISRNMAETGNYLVPIWNTQPFYDKPPLFYWLSAFSIKLLKESEFSVRLISALSGIGTVLATYAFAKRQWGRSAAFVSTLVLLSTPAFLYRGRTGNLDSLLAFFLVGSIFTVYQTERNKAWWLISGVFFGLAFLTKWLVAFIFPFITLGYFLIQRNNKDRLVYLLGSLSVGLAIVVIWFLTSYVYVGDNFLRQFFIHQREKIISTGSMWQNFSWEYLSYLKSGMKIWFILLTVSLFYVLFSWKKLNLILLPMYFIFLIILWSVVEVKSNWFLLPLYPLAALFIGYFMISLSQRFRDGNVLILLLALFIAGFQLFQYRNEYFVPDVAGDEARVAIASRELTSVSDIIYLTHYYYPTAVYYSRRKTYAVYSERQFSASWWILPKSSWSKILDGDRIFINTTKEDFKELKNLFPAVQFNILFQSGDKLLVKKV